jgi:hypothetical protein
MKPYSRWTPKQDDNVSSPKWIVEPDSLGRTKRSSRAGQMDVSKCLYLPRDTHRHLTNSTAPYSSHQPTLGSIQSLIKKPRRQNIAKNLWPNVSCRLFPFKTSSSGCSSYISIRCSQSWTSIVSWRSTRITAPTVS